MSLLRADPDQAIVAQRLDALREFLQPCSGALLDIGCGGGVLSDGLAQQGFHVTGIDPYVASGAPASRVRGSAHALPIADDTFDHVLLHWSLHHVPQALMDRALGEALRVLRAAGTLYVIEPEPVGSWQAVSCAFHDETEVQAMAAEVVNRLVVAKGCSRRRAYYFSEDRYPQFDAFVDDMMSLAYNRYRVEDIRQDVVRDAFEACAREDAYVLHQRIRMEAIQWLENFQE